jgi:hypothetical protein
LGAKTILKVIQKSIKKRSRKREENETLELRKGAQREPKWSPKHDKKRSQIGVENGSGNGAEK